MMIAAYAARRMKAAIVSVEKKDGHEYAEDCPYYWIPETEKENEA